MIRNLGNLSLATLLVVAPCLNAVASAAATISHASSFLPRQPAQEKKKSEEPEGDALQDPSGRWLHIGREPWELERLLSDITADGTAADVVTAIEQAERLIDAEDWDEARKTLDKPIKREPKNIPLHYARALVRLRKPTSFGLDDPRKDLEAVLRQQPLYRDAFEIWLALNPTDGDMKRVGLSLEGALGEPGADAERLSWILAALELRRGKKGKSKPGKALKRLEAHPPEDEQPSPAVERAMLVKVRALYEAERDEEAQQLYYRLVDLGDERMIERLYRDVVLLLKPEEKRSFEDSSLADKRIWFHKCWNRIDPLPADGLNPRIGEHYRRLDTALRQYGLRSNGNGYFTDWESFLTYSPKLDYYAPARVFEDQQATGYWLDHRGLWTIRHGKADGIVRPDHKLEGVEFDRNQTWVYSRFMTRPLVVHLVQRHIIHEWVQVLSLGVAVSEFMSNTRDKPEAIAGEMFSGDDRAFRALYASRSGLHEIYWELTSARSSARILRLLEKESQTMAGFAKAGRLMSSTDYYGKQDLLAAAVSLVDWRKKENSTQVLAELAISTENIKWNQVAEEDPAFEVSLLVFDDDWGETIRRIDKVFPLDLESRQEGSDFEENFDVGALEPADYNFALQIREPSSGRIGLLRGHHTVDYFDSPWVNLSDFSLRIPSEQATSGEIDKENTDTSWLAPTLTDSPVVAVPLPQREVKRSQPAYIAYQIYGLHPDEQGNCHYAIEQRLLKIGKASGKGDTALGIAAQVAQFIFPFYTFIALTGLFGLGRATVDPEAGLMTSSRKVEEEAHGAVDGVYWIDPRELEKAYYELYITIKDLDDDSRTTKSLIFQVVDGH
ncbi:MAG: hypothetical protein ACE5HV_02815 [Acidobacteriota bacterium]